MSLFVVQHIHDAETFPAGYPEMGPMLLQHMSEGNVAKSGAKVPGGCRPGRPSYLLPHS